MKKILIIPIQFLIYVQCLAGIRVMEPDDPNRDPKWEWFHNQKVNLFSSINGPSVTKHEARLPFHTPGTILNGHSQIDAYPEDGWILVHRDFGTEKEAQTFPFSHCTINTVVYLGLCSTTPSTWRPPISSVSWAFWMEKSFRRREQVFLLLLIPQLIAAF